MQQLNEHRRSEFAWHSGLTAAIFCASCSAKVPSLQQLIFLVGVMSALVTTRMMRSFLYGVQPSDPLTFVTEQSAIFGP
jgi:hypothetical protein